MNNICEQTGAPAFSISAIFLLWRKAPAEEKPVVEVKEARPRPSADKAEGRPAYTRDTVRKTAASPLPAARTSAPRRQSRG